MKNNNMLDKQALSIIKDFYNQCNGVGISVFPCYDDSLYALKLVIELAEECLQKNHKAILDDYIKLRKTTINNVPDFDEGWVVVIDDNNVVDNKIWTKEDAEIFCKRYIEECPSLISNNARVVKVRKEDLKYGEFPYEDRMFLTKKN